MATTTPNIDQLVDALVGAFIDMTAEEQCLVVRAYRLLSEGAPVELGVIARASGWTPADAGARLRSWPGVFLDGDGRLVGLWGLAAEAVSSHRARFADNAPVWMWCALDPLFIVPLLDASAVVSSICPTTGQPIQLSVGAAGVATVEPASAVVSFLMPNGTFDADVRQTFCHFVHFYSSPAAADVWVDAHPGAFWFSVIEAAEVGCRLAGEAFPTALRA